VTRPVQIRLTPHPTLLATYGWLRPRILLPQAAAAWPAERLRAVLTHEMAHVRRGDWVPLMLAQLVRAAHWFNPLMWVAARRLGHESERACDDMVLELGVGAQEYAAQLLEVARAAADGGRQPRALPVLPVAHRSNLERRVKAMLNAHVNRSPVTWRIRVATTAALAGVALVGAGLGAAAQTLSTFSGVVVDPTKSGIPRATVVLTNEERQTKHEVRSDEAGRFEFVGLPPGEYRLEARVPGFSTMKGSVRVAGYDVGLTVTLSIGSVHETVTVSSAPPAAAPTAAGQQVSPGSAAPGQGSRSTSLAAAEGCRPSAAGGQLTPPRKLKHVPPVYPADLAAAGIGGTVVLDGRIGTDGTIDAVDVKEAVDPRLATAAADAVRQWRFSPTLLNCAPVEVNITTTVRFVPAST
jgi:TonB family protein